MEPTPAVNCKWPSDVRDTCGRALDILLKERRETGLSVGISTSIAMRCLLEQAKPAVTYRELLKALTSDPAPASLADVEARLSVKAVTPAPQREWWLIIPVSLKLDGFETFEVEVLRCSVKLTSSTSWMERHRTAIQNASEEVRQLQHSSRQLHDPSCLLIMQASGLSEFDAWHSISPTFEVFKGVVEAAFSIGTMTLSSAALQHRKVTWAEYCLLLDKYSNEVRDFRFFYPSTSGPSSPFPPRVLPLTASIADRARRLSASVASTDRRGATSELIANAFRLYSYGMDQPFDAERLLHLWQVAETVTLANRHGGDTSCVCKRLAWMWRKHDGGEDVVLPVLLSIAQKRNKLVHAGIHTSITQEDANILKILCENAIYWLIAFQKRLPTQDHLELLFEWRSTSNSKLTAATEVAAFIHETRDTGQI